jgi:hypothetical protein
MIARRILERAVLGATTGRINSADFADFSSKLLTSDPVEATLQRGLNWDFLRAEFLIRELLMIRKLFAATAAWTLVACALATSASAASIIVDSHGFEQPFFTTTFLGSGQLEGQTPATFNGTWLRTKGPGTGTANVENSVVGAGAQAVEVHRNANSDDRWGVPVSGYPSIGQSYICIDWSMRVEQTTGQANTFGPFFCVEAYDDDAASIGLLGSLGVDASNGEVLYQVQDTGFLTAAGPTVAFGVWNDYRIELNYNAHTYRFFLNGALLGQTGFVDQNNVVGGLNEFTDADIAAIAAAGDALSQALGGTAYFDNFIVTESNMPCIPEPAAGVLAAIGLSCVAMKRRVRA